VGKAQEEAEEAVQIRLKRLGKFTTLVASPHVWSETRNAEIANLGARFSQNILAEM